MVWVQTCHDLHAGQSAGCESWFFPLWVLGIDLRLQGSVGGAFPAELLADPKCAFSYRIIALTLTGGLFPLLLSTLHG